MALSNLFVLVMLWLEGALNKEFTVSPQSKRCGLPLIKGLSTKRKSCLAGLIGLTLLPFSEIPLDCSPHFSTLASVHSVVELVCPLASDSALSVSKIYELRNFVCEYSRGLL